MNPNKIVYLGLLVAFFNVSFNPNLVAAPSLAEASPDGAVVASNLEASVERLLRTKRCVGCTLDGANLEGADLAKADLTDASLQGAKLKGAHLEEAILYGTDLRAADLRGAFLKNARVYEVILYQANLEGANTQGVVLEERYFKEPPPPVGSRVRGIRG